MQFGCLEECNKGIACQARPKHSGASPPVNNARRMPLHSPEISPCKTAAHGQVFLALQLTRIPGFGRQAGPGLSACLELEAMFVLSVGQVETVQTASPSLEGQTD